MHNASMNSFSEMIFVIILSAQVGVGLKFRVDKSDTAIVRDIVADGPADGSDIRLGGTSRFPPLFFPRRYTQLFSVHTALRDVSVGPTFVPTDVPTVGS